MTTNILLLDDSRVARLAVRRIITADFPDIALTDTSDIVEFETLLDRERFDLVLVDYNMPHENGLTVSSRLLEKHPGIRVALLTANIQSAIQQKAAALGIGFLAKPLRPDALHGLLDRKT